jgi:hypothetical protein
MIHLHFLGRMAPRRLGGGAALGGLLVLLAAGAAIASIPDSTGVINGCYNKVNGNLRVIDAASQTCRPDETAIFWSQTGPAGPQGPPGPMGQARAATVTQEMDIPCDESWHTFSSTPLAVTAAGSETVLLSGYFQSGDIVNSTGFPITGPHYSGRFVVDGSVVDGSTVSGQATRSVSFTHALIPGGGAHSFTMEISCPITQYVPPSGRLRVFTRTLAVQNLG